MQKKVLAASVLSLFLPEGEAGSPDLTHHAYRSRRASCKFDAMARDANGRDEQAGRCLEHVLGAFHARAV